jgi:hypothetical protein
MILGCVPIVRQDLGEAKRSGEQSQYSPGVKQPNTNETDRRTSALAKNYPLLLVQIDPHQEHDLAQSKEEASDIIHAEGVRGDVPSSAPKARNLLTSQGRTACRWETINRREW